uniref:Thioesterase domain-containing protein n=1 Tax=Mycena chlorophos TaxID=658473 RepID=A0ABQ0L6K0_MYCCL|nr:predicted protein [Mycena chlorophos]
MLKNDVDGQIPLAFVEEMHLVVSLCVAVLPHVPKAELSSPHSGFGAIHGAVLALATKCLASGRWLADISPQTDVEMLSASVLAIGHGAETKFDIQKRQKERLMRKCIVEYLGTASEFTEPEITPLLSPIVTAPRQEERDPHFLATIPTVGDALEALTLVARELVSEQRVAEGEARTLVGTAEMLLLLLWRHVLYYAEGGVPAANTASAGNGGLKASTATAYALRFLAAPDPETFRAEVGARLAPVLGRLAGLELNGEWLRGSAAAAMAIAGNAPTAMKELFSDLPAFMGQRRGGQPAFGHDIIAQMKVTHASVEPKAEEPSKKEGRVVVELPVIPSMLNGGGNVHGGCAAFLIDLCSTLSLLLLDPSLTVSQSLNVVYHSPATLLTVSQSLNVVYHSPATLGETLRIVNTTLTVGSRALSARTEIWNATKHRLVASGVHIKMQPSPAKL